MQPVVPHSSIPSSTGEALPVTPRRVVALSLGSPRGPRTEAPYAPEKPRQLERAATVQRTASPILDHHRHEILNLEPLESLRTEIAREGGNIRAIHPPSPTTQSRELWRAPNSKFHADGGIDELRLGNGSPQSLLTECSDDEMGGVDGFLKSPDKHLTCSPPPSLAPLQRFNQCLSAPREPSPHTTYGDQQGLQSLSEINEKYGAYFSQDCLGVMPNESFVTKSFVLSDAQIVFLEENQTVKDVLLAEIDIDDRTLKTLVSTIQDKTLAKLLLHRCPNLKDLGFLTEYRRLEWLRISSCPNLNPDCFFKVADNTWRHLVYLDFQDSPVTDLMILGLPILRSLLHINLSYTNVTFSGLLDLCVRQPSLKSIGIKGLRLKNEDISILKEQRPDMEFIQDEKQHPAFFDAPEVEVELHFQSAEHFAILQGFILEETHGQVNYWTKLAELSLFQDAIEGFYRAHLKALKIDHLVAEQNPLSSYRGWYVAENLIQNDQKRNLVKIFLKLIPLVRKTAKEFTVKTRVRDLDERDEVRNRKEIQKRCFEHLASLNLCRSQLARIKELNLSAIEIDEIPLFFCNLSWAHLEKLSLNGNKNVIRIPPCYLDGKYRTIHPFSRFSNLRELDLSNMGLRSVDGLLSFVPFPTHAHSLGKEEPKEDEKMSETMKARREKDLMERRVAVLPRLGKLNLAGNKLQFFEDVGITEEHGSEMTEDEKRRYAMDLLLKDLITDTQIAALDSEGFFPKRLEVDLSKNPLSRLAQKTLDEFGKSKIQTTLYLKGVKLGTHPLPSFPSNVKPIFDRTMDEDLKEDV